MENCIFVKDVYGTTEYFQDPPGSGNHWDLYRYNSDGHLVNTRSIGADFGLDALRIIADNVDPENIKMNIKYYNGKWSYEYKLLNDRTGIYIAANYDDLPDCFYVKVADQMPGIKASNPTRRKLIRS